MGRCLCSYDIVFEWNLEVSTCLQRNLILLGREKSKFASGLMLYDICECYIKYCIVIQETSLEEKESPKKLSLFWLSLSTFQRLPHPLEQWEELCHLWELCSGTGTGPLSLPVECEPGATQFIRDRGVSFPSEPCSGVCWVSLCFAFSPWSSIRNIEIFFLIIVQYTYCNNQ